MPIVTHVEDILPDIKNPVSEAEAKPDAALAAAFDPGGAAEAAPAISRDVSGCLSLIGPLALCWDLNLSTPSAYIALKVGPFVVASGEISPARPCLTLKGSYGVAKWELNVCLRLAQKAITLNGRACVTLLGCKSFDVTLFRW